jgi:hypothetical protein
MGDRGSIKSGEISDERAMDLPAVGCSWMRKLWFESVMVAASLLSQMVKHECQDNRDSMVSNEQIL